MEKLLKQLFIISVAISITLVNGNILLSEVMLRDRPVKLSLNQIVACVKSNNFFDVKYNPEGDFQNEFVDNGDGTITDRATGLMWERSGLNKETLFSWAEKYIKSLNKSKFAGYNDWRLPTVEELYTLLSPNRGGETFSDPILLCNTKTFWTSDKSLSVVDFSIYGNAMPGGQWVSDRKITINFQTGSVSEAVVAKGTGAYESHAVTFSSGVRAVRSINKYQVLNKDTDSYIFQDIKRASGVYK